MLFLQLFPAACDLLLQQVSIFLHLALQGSNGRLQPCAPLPKFLYRFACRRIRLQQGFSLSLVNLDLLFQLLLAFSAQGIRNFPDLSLQALLPCLKLCEMQAAGLQFLAKPLSLCFVLGERAFQKGSLFLPFTVFLDKAFQLLQRFYLLPFGSCKGFQKLFLCKRLCIFILPTPGHMGQYQEICRLFFPLLFPTFQNLLCILLFLDLFQKPIPLLF